MWPANSDERPSPEAMRPTDIGERSSEESMHLNHKEESLDPETDQPDVICNETSPPLKDTLYYQLNETPPIGLMISVAMQVIKWFVSSKMTSVFWSH